MTQFVPLVVPSPGGPHVTLTAGVEAFGRYWTTTSRSAYKARAIRRHGAAGYTVTADGATAPGELTVATTGTAVVVDPFRPWSALTDIGAAATAPLAVARIGVSNLRQVMGYLESFGDVVPGWSLTDRVVIAVAPRREIRVRAAAWASPVLWGRSPQTLGHGLVSASRSAEIPERVRRFVVEMSTGRHPCVAGLGSTSGQFAIPAVWDGDGLALPATVSEHVHDHGGWSAMFDHSDDRRPGEKYGFFIRGTASGGVLAPSLLTWWDGFRSGTVRLGGRGSTDDRAA